MSNVSARRFLLTGRDGKELVLRLRKDIQPRQTEIPIHSADDCPTNTSKAWRRVKYIAASIACIIRFFFYIVTQIISLLLLVAIVAVPLSIFVAVLALCVYAISPIPIMLKIFLVFANLSMDSLIVASALAIIFTVFSVAVGVGSC